MAQSFSIVDFYWGGEKVTIKPGGTFKLGGMVNVPVLAGGQVFRGQKMAQSEVNVKGIVTAGQRVTDLYGAALEQPMQVVADTGQIFSWDSAFRVDTLDITAGENGEIDLKFVGGTPMET